MITLNDGTIVTQADFDEAVQLGVKILDEVWGVGAWREEIDLAKLDMRHPKNCVLGQLYGEYCFAPWSEIEEIDPTIGERCDRRHDVVVGPFELGRVFYRYYDETNEVLYFKGYEALTEAWRKEIHWDADDAFKTAKDM